MKGGSACCTKSIVSEIYIVWVCHCGQTRLLLFQTQKGFRRIKEYKFFVPVRVFNPKIVAGRDQGLGKTFLPFR